MSRPTDSPTRATVRPVASSREATSPLVRRFFTKAGVHPFDEVTWVKRDASVGSGDKKVFEQKGVEFPDFWTPNAVAITVAKYFRGKLGTPERETSLRQAIGRVTKTIRSWGEQAHYFENADQANIFQDELTHLLLYQKASFNSPVWFNVGTVEKPQSSACFILSVEDDMRSILEWIRTEGMIFKGGSGSGVNVSALRSKRESLSAGGRASGPVSFMRGADSVAGMIKSGGVTRRAAKMVIMNIDHPDVMEFIRCKAEEEKKIQAFAAAGYNMADLNDDAWSSIQFQNANNSVRVTDEFMRTVEADGNWQTRYRVSGETADTYRARDVLLAIAQAAWECGDPGLQFDSTINTWHTCPNSGRINGSNPCSEYMSLDNSACNLASINLMKFLRVDGTFAVEEFKQAADVFILAQDILVDGSSYPTEKIAQTARDFRQLGLGYANLGALLMTKGLPYDSEESRVWAAAITSLMTGEAYRVSANLARRLGPFNGYTLNREPMLGVIRKHRAAAQVIATDLIADETLVRESRRVWDQATSLGEQYGYRNSQTTLLAPTGTIAFMMDCDTTGIEPDFSLVKMKQLVGGGWMKIVNSSVRSALLRLNYTPEQAAEIEQWVYGHGTVEGAPYLKPEHTPVFDCAAKPAEGDRSISWQGHVRMVAAAQPFLSGAVSKTFNMPHEATREEIFDSYMMAWRLGIKAFAVYRDGSKATQPLNTSQGQKSLAKSAEPATPTVFRRRLPPTRQSETHKFSVAGHEGYLTYSMYEDGAPAELFIRIAKQGSTLSGLLDAFAIAISLALQYGVPLKALAHKYIHSRFEPAGFTENPDIRIATSILDYIFRYLALRFLSDEDLVEFGMQRHSLNDAANGDRAPEVKPDMEDGIPAETVCRKCGGIMQRTGTCLTCRQCGTSSGGCS
ncbi:MAG: vitamin B12-dependent ribonucleotide reductase [Candidatus Liptonbacteria bacterium]|nr:vitamin B12-dependent ribonucleotide reductase [Candidatus Liptonbacteria bacterium]